MVMVEKRDGETLVVRPVRPSHMVALVESRIRALNERKSRYLKLGKSIEGIDNLIELLRGYIS